MTAVHVKTTQECKLTTRLIGASSVTLPFKNLMLCWAVVRPQLEFFCPVLGTNAKRNANKMETWMLMGQEIIGGAVEESVAIKSAEEIPSWDLENKLKYLSVCRDSLCCSRRQK